MSSAFLQTNLVSSRSEDGADLLDPAFINAWGLAIRPAGAGGHWWITNTDTSRVTLYVGDSPTVPFTQDGLSVLGVPGADGPATEIEVAPPTRDGTPLPPPDPTPATLLPPSNPTGQVYSGSTTDFLVDGTSLTGAPLVDAPARFITVSEDGTVAAWGEAAANSAGRMDAFAVVVDNSAPDADGIHAIYKGVAVSAETGSGNLLYAANFSQNRVDVFDADWQPVAMAFEAVAPGGRDIADYAPFNVERVHDASLGRDVLIIAYAKVADAAGGEEESTGGFVAKFDLDGTFLTASDAGGRFNAPWGVALAPAEWGEHDGALLVGNFGDGRILALDAATLEFDGFLLDDADEPVVVDGLWDLIFGNGANLGAADRLYFAAGPEEESAGLFGSLSLLPTEDLSLRGTRGADRLQGGTGADTMNGGAEGDLLRASAGDDVARGAAGRDTIEGGTGDDRVVGGEGDDLIAGGTGRDAVLGGAGADTMAGGEGGDRFRFFAAAESAPDAPDLITDFTATGADRDRIDLRGLGELEFVGGASFGGAGGELHFEEAAAGRWLVEADVDGDAQADFALMVVADGAPEARWFIW